MKIRNERLIHAAGFLGSTGVRALVHTLRVEYRFLGETVAPISAIPDGPRYIYSIWHENLLLPAAFFGHPDLAVLISRHADGQILGSLINSMGMGMVCGSSSRGGSHRGGIEAVRGIISGTVGRRHLVVTPDGPRGPRREVQQGMVYIASRTGMKIVCIGVGLHRPWRAKSWDKFAIPRPTSRAKLIASIPISVPEGLKSSDLDEWRTRVQAEMDSVSLKAERWVDSNRFEADTR